jgi:hypothetical protein
MVRPAGRSVLAATVATLLVAAACRDAQGPEPSALLIPGLPGFGAITVSAATTGSSMDPDGYTITVDLIVESKGIPTNGSVTFTGVPPGVATVSISDVASNCSVTGSSLQIVTVPLGGTAGVGFAISCAGTPPPTGELTVSTTTGGPNPDADGYTVTLDESSGRAIGTNASTTFTGLTAGSHTVVLSGVAGNCSVTDGTSRTVSVTAGSTASTSFAVSCSATPPQTGDLTVATTTGGSNPDADGYTVTLDESSGRAIGTNASTTFTGLTAGSHTVVLSGVAGNCTASDGTSRTVDVPAGGTASASFTVSCAAVGGDGSLTVTTNTTGSSLDPDGYTVTVDGSASQAIAANGSVSFTGPAGDHQVELSGVAANCTVSGANPRSVTVPAGGTTSTQFDVSCAGAPPPTGTRVTGRGAIGAGSATPGSDRQEFDFEATDVPSGRLAATDYSVVRADGRVGRMTVDPASDAATGMTSLSRTSAACVRFTGNGRLDTGELFAFFADVCDNGSPEAGQDTFSITIPDRGGPGQDFVRSGTLTEGDIVISAF